MPKASLGTRHAGRGLYLPSPPEDVLSSVAIPVEDLGLPALLTIWPLCDLAAKGVEPREMSSLREALGCAFDELRAGTGSPWIITADGLILTPASLMALLPFADEFEAPAA